MAQELLLCVRAISNYQALWDGRAETAALAGSGTGAGASAYVAGTTLLRADGCARAAVAPGATDAAWAIYSTFIRPGAPYEVSVSHRRRKIIAQQLAAPEPDMFDRLQVRGCWPAWKRHRPVPCSLTSRHVERHHHRSRSRRTWRLASTWTSSTPPNISKRCVAAPPRLSYLPSSIPSHTWLTPPFTHAHL